MTDQLTKNTTLSSNRPQSMYQFRRSSDSKRFHQFDPHHDDADAELRRQHNLTQSEKAKEMAKAGVKIGMDWVYVSEFVSHIYHHLTYFPQLTSFPFLLIWIFSFGKSLESWEVG